LGKFTHFRSDRKWVKMILRDWGGLFFGGEEYAACLIVDADDVGAEEIHA
jgi:hypothetical protein